MNKYKLKGIILSPLHIGTGNQIEPFDYVIKNGKFYRISLEDFLYQLSEGERKIFESIVNSGNLNRIRKYVIEEIDLEKYSAYSVKVTEKIERLYLSKINDIQNQLLINPFIRTGGENKPYIPGSSIKGAIRTALISQIAQNSNLSQPTGYREEFEFEFRVLRYTGRGKNDPFRGIKIADGILPPEPTIISQIRNVTKDRNGNLQPTNIQLICDVTYSKISGKSIEFESNLTIDTNLFSTNYLSRPFTIGEIKKACNSFYRDKLSIEDKNFYSNSPISHISNSLLNEEIEDDSFLIRLGRFSGVESVTIDNYRNPKPPGKKRTWGKSRNLVEMKYPLGWVKIRLEEIE